MFDDQAQVDLFGPALNAPPPWIFDPLERGAYSLIMADPPWKYLTRSPKGLGKSPDRHYKTMTLKEIIATFPLGDLAAKDSVLWLWATAPMLDQQLTALKAWGFKFVSSGVWVKRTSRGKIAFGGGYTFRNAHEIVLLGSKGSPKYPNRNVRSVFDGPLREHSRKPEESYEVARRLVPYGRAADVFSRQSRPGWDNWGDQRHLFDEAAA
jgi:N6-adenosine-specific RNA methylase IME4